MKFLLLLLMVPQLAFATMTLNPAVTQGNIKSTICRSGWTKTVRPGVPYTNFVKKQYMKDQGLSDKPMSDYELDHIVPLELGGHPYSYDNLQLQPWEGPDGAHAKDAVETWLKRQVCTGRIKLDDARTCIYSHWQQCKKEFGK